jgi:geranylgeranyl diphosphate synthase, type II
MSLEDNKSVFDEYLLQESHFLFKEKNTLNEAINYSLLSPGKRIRPLLCLGFSQGFKGSKDVALACGLSVEMIHAYSLIHDDLPAMDNDDFRRGKLTNHKVFGEALAILAGDSLLNLAPQFLLKKLQLLQFNPELTIKLVGELLAASGHDGMVKGQALDMYYESAELNGFGQEELDQILRKIHQLKTGSIIRWSCLAGLYSQGDLKTTELYSSKVQALGEDIGLLFQMVDDVLDVTATLADLGKTPGKDQKTGKLTYANLYGLAPAKNMSRNLAHKILNDLKAWENQGDWHVIQSIVKDLQSKID